MKKILLITQITLFIACKGLFAGTPSNSHFLSQQNPGTSKDTLTVTFVVNGNASCKSSIEGSVTANTGVISASWTAGSQSITISYLSAKVKLSDLYSLLANAGYDNAELRAKDAVYAALPTSCQYTRQPITE